MAKVAARKLRPWESGKLHRMKRQLANTVNSLHARIILLSRGGRDNSAIAEGVACSAAWVRTIIHRFSDGGIEAITWYPPSPRICQIRTFRGSMTAVASPLQPEGLMYDSPGQRPGNGCPKATSPERAQELPAQATVSFALSGLPHLRMRVPRALPWAVESHPFRLRKRRKNGRGPRSRPAVRRGHGRLPSADRQRPSQCVPSASLPYTVTCRRKGGRYPLPFRCLRETV